MGLLTDMVCSGVFGDHLLAATRRTLYEHRIIIPGRRRLSELAGEAATTVERHALEVIEREIPAATRAQWSAALSQSIGDTHCEFSEKLSFFDLRTSLKKQELSPRAADYGSNTAGLRKRCISCLGTNRSEPPCDVHLGGPQFRTL